MSPVLARYSIGPKNATRDRGRAWCIRNLVEKSGLRRKILGSQEVGMS